MSEHGKDLMDKESRLLADLQDFNTKYDRYIACTNNFINPGNKMGCSAMDTNKQTVIAALDKLNASSIIDVSNAVIAFKKDSRTVSPAVYDASYQQLTKTYNNDILTLRNELDAKLMEIYSTEGSITSDIMKSYDATIYVGLLWTILATTGLYFVFTKL